MMISDQSRASRSGDSGAEGIEALYRRERLAMVRLAHLITGSNPLAEEIVQDAFLRLARAWDGAENPGGYLRVIVVNLCRDQLRRFEVERRVQVAPPIATHQPELDETWEVLRRLPPRQRAALALRFYEDLSEAEIASLLECRPATVRSLVHRGLARLRRELS